MVTWHEIFEGEGLGFIGIKFCRYSNQGFELERKLAQGNLFHHHAFYGDLTGCTHVRYPNEDRIILTSRS
jgi:hypothetical protein